MKKRSFIGKLKQAFSFPSISGLLIGLIGGFMYYQFIGCSSAGCAITGNPWLTMLWGAIAGYLVGDIFNKKPNTKTPEPDK